MNRKLTISTVLAAAAIVFATSANAHFDRPSCYIEVHDACFNNTTSPCTNEDYQGFLDNCDATYPSVVPLPLGPQSLISPDSSGQRKKVR